MFPLRSTAVAALVLSLCVACGGEEVEPPRRDPALVAEVEDFPASDLERKPFKAFVGRVRAEDMRLPACRGQLQALAAVIGVVVRLRR